MPIFSRLPRRQKTFGTPQGIPLDANQKRDIRARAGEWNDAHRQPGQHWGPITPKFFAVLDAILWGFHNSKTGLCFPSYDSIAAKADCCRDTVFRAIKVFERAGLLTWDHRLRRIAHHAFDFLGRRVEQVRVVRSSNAYRFTAPAPQTRASPPFSSKSEFRTGTLIQALSSLSTLCQPAKIDPESALERALARFGRMVTAR